LLLKEHLNKQIDNSPDPTDHTSTAKKDPTDHTSTAKKKSHPVSN